MKQFVAPKTDPSFSRPNTGFVPELEQEVLGSLLMNGNVKQVAGTLKPDNFVEPLHRDIFANMLVADERYGTARLDVVYRLFSAEYQELVKSKLGIPLSEYLARLAANCVHGSAGLRTSVPAMMQQWARISIGLEAGNVHAASLDPGSDPAELAKHLGHSVDNIVSSIRGGKRGRTRFTLGDAAEDALTAIDEAVRRGSGLTGISWGLADVNRATGGIRRGELTVLGARPGMGKSLVALSAALKAASTGVGVGFISLEMLATTLAMRAMSDFAYNWNVKVPFSDMLAGRVEEREFQALLQVRQDFEKIPLQIEDASGLTMTDIRTKFERMSDVAARAGTPIELLVVDYLQLVTPSSRYQGNRVNEVTEISGSLRNMAREYNVAMLALSQLSRGVESRPIHERRPMLSDLRESGAIEQDADTVIFLFREAYYLAKEKGKDADAEADRLDRLAEVENKLEFILAKNRNGAVKTIDLFIDVPFSAVRSAARPCGEA